MNSNRLRFVLLHTLYHFRHSLETWVDIFWNPIIQLWVYTLIAVSFTGAESMHGTHILVGMIMFQIIWVGEYALTVGALWEIWAQSFSSLFMSPLTMNEFLVGQMISSAIKSFLSVCVCAVVANLLYHFSLLSLGWIVGIYFLELLIFAWATGLMVLSLIFRYSTQVQSLSWTLVFLVQPFGAVFYPVSILPPLLQKAAFGLPATYVFEAMRAQLDHHTVMWDYVVMATLLNTVWLILGWALFQWTYKEAKKSGAFARLEG